MTTRRIDEHAWNALPYRSQFEKYDNLAMDYNMLWNEVQSYRKIMLTPPAKYQVEFFLRGDRNAVFPTASREEANTIIRTVATHNTAAQIVSFVYDGGKSVGAICQYDILYTRISEL